MAPSEEKVGAVEVEARLMKCRSLQLPQLWRLQLPQQYAVEKHAQQPCWTR
jgi:hypothetical protein